MTPDAVEVGKLMLERSDLRQKYLQADEDLRNVTGQITSLGAALVTLEYSDSPPKAKKLLSELIEQNGLTKALEALQRIESLESKIQELDQRLRDAGISM